MKPIVTAVVGLAETRIAMRHQLLMRMQQPFGQLLVRIENLADAQVQCADERIARGKHEMAQPTSALRIERNRSGILGPRGKRRHPRAVSQGDDGTFGDILGIRRADVGQIRREFLLHFGNRVGVDFAVHFGRALQSDIRHGIEHEGMVKILRIGDFAFEEPITPAPQFFLHVAAPPSEKILARLEHFGLNPPRPGDISRVTKMLADRPKHGTRLELVSQTGLDETILSLTVEKELNAALRQLVITERIVELNDRRRFRADRGVPSHDRRQRAALAHAQRGNIQVQETRAHAFFDSWIGQAIFAPGGELPAPK